MQKIPDTPVYLYRLGAYFHARDFALIEVSRRHEVAGNGYGIL